MYKIKNHCFNIQAASDFGINGAIIINNIQFWIQKNKDNHTNFHEGRFWTYNTYAAFAKQFSYLSINTIRREIKKLVKSGVLIASNFNKSNYDRTLWYAFNDEHKWLSGEDNPPVDNLDKKVVSDLQNGPNGIKQVDKPPLQASESAMLHKCQIEMAQVPNRNGRSTAPIPDINAVINTDKRESEKPEPQTPAPATATPTPSPTHSNDSLNSKTPKPKTPKPQKAQVPKTQKATRITDDWRPTHGQAMELADKYPGLDLETELAKFIAWHSDKGARSSDWGAKLEQWVSNDKLRLGGSSAATQRAGAHKLWRRGEGNYSGPMTDESRAAGHGHIANLMKNLVHRGFA